MSLPKGWNLYPLAQITQTKRPVSYGIVQTGEPLDEGIPCVRVVDLASGDLNTSKMIKTTQQISSSYKRTVLLKNDLMFALRGEIGCVAKVQSELVGCNLTRGVALIAPNDLVDSDFLLQQIKSANVRREIMSGVNGSALQEIPIKSLRKVQIPVPPLPEQKKIAEILLTWDKAIEVADKTVQEYEIYVRGQLNKFFSKLGRLSEMVKISEVFDVKSGGTPNRSNPSYFGGDIPWLKSGEVSQGEIFLAEEFLSVLGLRESSATLIPANSPVIAMYGATAGKVGILRREMAINQAIAALVPRNDVLKTEYLYLCLKYLAPMLLKKVQGSGQPNLNAGMIKELKVPLISKEQQDLAIKFIMSIFSQRDSCRKMQNLLRTQKKGLMQKLLTGKVRVKV